MYPMPFSADIHNSSKMMVEEIVNSLPNHVERLHALQSIASAAREQLAAVSQSYLFSLAPAGGIELQFSVIRGIGGDGKTESDVIARVMGLTLGSDEPSDELDGAETESIIEVARVFGLKVPESRPALDRWLESEAAKPLTDFLSAAWGAGWLTFSHCGKLNETPVRVTGEGFKPIADKT